MYKQSLKIENFTPLYLLCLEEMMRDGKIKAALLNAYHLQKQIDMQCGTDESDHLQEVIFFLNDLKEMPL